MSGKAELLVTWLIQRAAFKRNFVRDAAKVRSEPIWQHFCVAAYVGCQETVKNLQQLVGF